MYGSSEWGKAFGTLTFLAALGVVLGIWKLIEIVAWLIQHARWV